MDNEVLEKKKSDRRMDEVVAPDGGWGWVVCLSSFFCNFLASGVNVSVGVLLVGLLQTFNESVTKTSIVFAMMNGVTMMISPLISGFLPYFSHRQIIIAGSLLGAISTFASAFVTSIDLMIFTFGFMGGVSLGMVFFAANVIVSLYFTKRRGIAVGIANAGAGFGTFVMNFALEKLIKYYALRGMFILLSGFILNLVVFGALCRPLEPRKKFTKEQDALVSQQNESSDLEKIAIAEQIDNEKEDMLKKQQLEEDTKKDCSGRCMEFGKLICNILDVSSLKNSKAIMLIVIFFLWSANQVVMLYLPFYCVSIGMSTAEGAILMSVIGIGLTIGELTIGIFLDIFHIKSDHLMTFSLICLGLTTLTIPWLYDLYSIGALITIWSIAVGFGVSLRVLLIVELLGVENLAPVYSFVTFSNGLGYGVIPPIFGWLYDKTKSFHVIFKITSAFFFISLIFTCIINYQLKRRTSQNRVVKVEEKVTDE